MKDEPQLQPLEKPVQRVIPNDYLAGIDMLRQDYLATVSELKHSESDTLSKLQLDLRRAELRKEHRLHCAQEWSVISSQMKADLEV
jgi:hypothetical protein